MRRSSRCADQQISHFGAFNEVVVNRELTSSIQNVLINFGNSRIIIDLPTVMLQQDVYQNIQIGERTLSVNMPIAISHLLSGDFPIHRIDEQTIAVDAEAMIKDFPIPESSTKSWEREHIQHDFSEQGIIFLVLESLFPNVENVTEIIKEIFDDWSVKEVEEVFELIRGMLFNHEETTDNFMCKLMIICTLFHSHTQFDSSNLISKIFSVLSSHFGAFNNAVVNRESFNSIVDRQTIDLVTSTQHDTLQSISIDENTLHDREMKVESKCSTNFIKNSI